MKPFHLDSKQLVELSQGQMFVLHFPPRVLDAVNGAVEELGGRRRMLGEVLRPGQRHFYQLVEEDALHGLGLQHWQGSKTEGWT